MNPKAETQPMLGGPQSPLYCCVGSTACISLRTLPHTSTGAIKKKGRKHPPACLRQSTKEGKLDIGEKGGRSVESNFHPVKPSQEEGRLGKKLSHLPKCVFVNQCIKK